MSFVDTFNAFWCFVNDHKPPATIASLMIMARAIVTQRAASRRGYYHRQQLHGLPILVVGTKMSTRHRLTQQIAASGRGAGVCSVPVG
jgi:hypothetical protein